MTAGTQRGVGNQSVYLAVHVQADVSDLIIGINYRRMAIGTGKPSRHYMVLMFPTEISWTVKHGVALPAHDTDRIGPDRGVSGITAGKIPMAVSTGTSIVLSIPNPLRAGQRRPGDLGNRVSA